MRHLRRWLFPCVVVALFAAQAFAVCDPIGIVHPPNGGTVQRTPSESVFLKWHDVPGATSYDVYFGTPGQACNSVAYATGVTSSDFQPDSSDIENGESYEWKVVANGTGCPSAPTTGCKTFTVAPCPNPPTLTSPANGAEFGFGNVTLQWNAVANIHDYQLYVGIDGDEPSLAVTTTATSKTFFVEPGRDIEWYVVARAHGCDDAASAARTFSTFCPTTPPSATSPANGATFGEGEQITFHWSAVPGSEGYDVKVNNGEEWIVIAENLTVTTFSISSLPQGDYQWEVRANFNSCEPLYSEPRELVIGPSCQGGDAPRLVSPANDATVTPPVRFEWRAVDGAIGYILRARKTTDTVSRTLTTTNNLSYTTNLEAGTYEWWVVADYDDCPNAESSRRTVTVEDDGACPANPAKATLVSPANGAGNLSSPVTFQWNAVAGAKGYRVLAGFGNGELESLGSTTATSLTVPLPAGSGAWAVQTFFGEDCPTTLSDRRTFTVTNGAPCGTVPPQLVSPAPGANVEAAQVTFSWTGITGATRYGLFVAVGGDDDFEFYGETPNTSLTRFVPVGPVQWYVVASFAACPVLESGRSSFTVTEPECPPATPISLVEPANNSTVTSPTRFVWTGVQGASAYRVWVSAGAAAPVAVARTTATEATVSLPAGTMRWYVEAIRERCVPVVSPEATFTIAPGANCGGNLPPTLVSPTGPRTNPAQVTGDVTLDWNPVEGALGYRVWIGRNGDAFMDVTLTRETEFVLQDLDGGLYAWFVQALFEACNPVDSERTFFFVATGDLCPDDAPTPLSPAQGSTPSSPVTFTWSDVGAGRYRVYASRNGGEPQLIGTTEETQLTRALPPGAYLWAVEAVRDECPSVFSQRVGFNIPEAQNCSTAGTTLLSPANGTPEVVPPMSFLWTPVSGAVKYVLVVRVNDGAPTPLTSTSETSFEAGKLPPGEIEWWVVTYFAACDPAESEHFRFGVPQPDCDSGRPILLIPTGRVPSPVGFQWTAVPRATRYRVLLARGDQRPSVVASTDKTEAEVELPEGTYEWLVEAEFPNCPSTASARAEFRVTPPVACGTPAKPEAQVVGQAVSGSSYRVRWNALPNVGLYEIQEATSPSFVDAKTFTTSSRFFRFEHEVSSAPVQYLYRVRGVSNCNEERGPYSDPVGVVITPPRTNNASAEIGAEGAIVQTVFLPGSTDPYTFTATSDKPWITITPSSGVLPAEGITLTVSADAAVLAPGTNTGTIRVQYTLASGAKANPKENALTSVNLPVSVSLVTPVFPTGKATPPPDSLIFPVVGHAQGFNNSLFESDIRVTNLTAQTRKYELHFTPSGTNGTTTGSSSTIEVGSGSTLALDDIVATLFGIGTTTGATGMLEVRPLETTSSASSSLFSTVTEGLIRQLDTAASSRTYNFTPNGTFGQYIPATRFSDFVGILPAGIAPQILSLQQVAQSAAFRANFGFAEASGEPANLMVRVFDIAGNLLATIPVNLQAGEHIQLNGMLANNGINDLEDGRVEVEVVGGNGKVTAYVSEVDNITNDPLLVSAVVKGAITANRYVVPGTAFANTGFAFWVTDMRVFNAGATDTPATLTFYPMANPGGAVSREITIEAGEIAVLNNVIGDLFGQPNGAAGMVAVTTPADTQLTATARTYNMAAAGTYGQYIPGVTPAESVGVADRPLQLLQLESSSRFRTNIGLAETTGQPATVEVSAIVPDIKFTPVITIPLAGNEFRQFSLADFGLGSVYNARVQIRVIEGNGRVTAYGSAIDQITQDPTYVPAQ